MGDLAVVPNRRQVIDALLRSNLSMFIQASYAATVPGAALVWHPYLDLIASRLQDVVEGRTRHFILTLPPRHLKSFCASVAMPAFYLGHHPTAEIMVVSYGQTLADRLGEQTRAVMSSAIYERIFANRLVSKRQPANLLRTVMGGLRRATSIDGVATGVGADLLIFDDPQKPGETLSDAVRRSTNAAFETTFLSRLNNPATARIVIVMQRLHEDDFVGHVSSLGGEWEILNLPAIAEADEVYAFKTCFGTHRFVRQEGEALHPVRIPLDELTRTREQVGEAAWATQFMQRPAPADGGIINVGEFVPYGPDERPLAFERVVQSWDTANKVEEWNDFSVCLTFGIKDGHAFLLDIYRQRVQYPDLKAAVVDLARRYQATTIVIEDKASGTQLIQELQRAGLTGIVPVMPVGDKKMRMSQSTSPIRSGLVHVPVESSFMAEFRHECVVFPNGRYRDQVDALSQALDHMFAVRTLGQGFLDYYESELR